MSDVRGVSDAGLSGLGALTRLEVLSVSFPPSATDRSGSGLTTGDLAGVLLESLRRRV
jgi:hypothetical protein